MENDNNNVDQNTNEKVHLNNPETENNTKQFLTNVTNLAPGIIKDLNNLSQNYQESQKISALTSIELKKIEENHKTINKNIDNEFFKQKKAMDVSEMVVNHGLESNDLTIIKLGLDSMIDVANHNPIANLKNQLNNETKKDFDDEDFYIEI